MLSQLSLKTFKSGCNGIFFALFYCCVFLEGTCSCSDSDETQQISAAYRFNTSCHRQQSAIGGAMTSLGFAVKQPCSSSCLTAASFGTLRPQYFVRCQSLECCVYCTRFLHTFVRCKASITHGIFLAIG